jgi:selenide,water dikinase
VHTVKRLLLVGAGHAHLFVLESLARAPLPGVETVLVSIGSQQLYSGMMPGWLAGDYALEQLAFGLPGLAQAAGARLEPSGARSVDAHRREVHLWNNQVLSYDVASFDIGSLAAGTDLPGVLEHTLTLKPLEKLMGLLIAATEQSGPLLVVGGGAAGVEMALCLQARTRRPTTLLESGDAVPRGAPRSAVRVVHRLLARREVTLRLGARVASVSEGSVSLTSGEAVPFTTCVWATGPKPNPLMASSGAALDAQGYLAVEDTLRSPSHPELFAAGDCAGFISGQRVPKAGVYAVRQGPVLVSNLRVALTGQGSLQPYRAQAGFLSLLNAGDGTAVGAWKGLAFHGRSMWRLKDSIDRRFMARFQRLGGNTPAPP